MSDTKCSRAGCQASAEWQLQWRNPKIHGVDRIKVWASCDEHLGYLTDYLSNRDFLIAAAPFGDAA